MAAIIVIAEHHMSRDWKIGEARFELAIRQDFALFGEVTADDNKSGIAMELGDVTEARFET
jgi:hypothetical protein